MSESDATLDLGDYKTAAGAAKALYRFLRDEHDAGDNVNLYSPDENPRQNDAWGVVWEGGPYEWAVWLTGGESLYCGEFERHGMSPEVTGFYDNSEWLAQPHYNFDLQFFNT